MKLSCIMSSIIYSKFPSLYACLKCGYARTCIGLVRKHVPKCTELDYTPVQKIGELKVKFMTLSTRGETVKPHFQVPICVDCNGTVNTNFECHACLVYGNVPIPPELLLSTVTKRQLAELLAEGDSEDEFV